MQMVKKEIYNIIDPDILELKKLKWNRSSSTAPASKLDHQKNLFEIRVGFADTKIPSLKSKRYYQGCEEIRSDYTGKIDT